MRPNPDWSLGSIFLPDPHHLSDWSTWVPGLPSPDGDQLGSVPGAGEDRFSSLRKNRNTKTSARSVPSTAGHLSGEILTNSQSDTQKSDKILSYEADSHQSWKKIAVVAVERHTPQVVEVNQAMLAWSNDKLFWISEQDQTSKSWCRTL